MSDYSLELLSKLPINLLNPPKEVTFKRNNPPVNKGEADLWVTFSNTLQENHEFVAVINRRLRNLELKITKMSAAEAKIVNLTKKLQEIEEANLVEKKVFETRITKLSTEVDLLLIQLENQKVTLEIANTQKNSNKRLFDDATKIDESKIEGTFNSASDDE